MKQEDKDLLLQDLCSRLPYGVKIQAINPDREFVIEELSTISAFKSNFDCNLTELYEIKPYLFPLSSMTHKQKAELAMLVVDVEDFFKSFLIEVEFYHKHHIDYRGLIPMGLAIDATGLNIY